MQHKQILTNSYKVLLILILLCSPLAAAAQDQEPRYRVEILVLTHLHHGQQPGEIPVLKDYSGALDFLAPEEIEDEIAEEEPGDAPNSDAAVESAGETLAEEDAELAEDEEPAEIDANAVFPVEEMSAVMSDAWRRLRLSAPFRPEQYLSWEQGSQAPFPLLRIHDLKAVWVDDPWADVRQALAELPELPPGAFVADPESTGYVGDDELTDQLLPEPTVFYRLDGTATLRRTRFLHLDLDLQLREAVYDLAPERFAEPPGPADEGDALPQAEPDAYLAFDMRQSRQVRSGRMEYFDSPVLGVLAYISIVEPETSTGTDPESP